eukprot:8130394-Pyramimonas_sp.AAC.3
MLVTGDLEVVEKFISAYYAWKSAMLKAASASGTAEHAASVARESVENSTDLSVCCRAAQSAMAASTAAVDEAKVCQKAGRRLDAAKQALAAGLAANTILPKVRASESA